MQFDIRAAHMLKGSFDAVAVPHVGRRDPAIRMETARKLSVGLLDFGFFRSMADAQDLVSVAGDERLLNSLHLFGNQYRWSFKRCRP